MSIGSDWNVCYDYIDGNEPLKKKKHGIWKVKFLIITSNTFKTLVALINYYLATSLLFFATFTSSICLWASEFVIYQLAKYVYSAEFEKPDLELKA